MAKGRKGARSSFALIPGGRSFSAWYFEHRLPIAPQRYSEILRYGRREVGEAARGSCILNFAFILLGALAISLTRRGARLQGVSSEGHCRHYRPHQRGLAGLSRWADWLGLTFALRITSLSASILAWTLAARDQRHQSPLARRHQYVAGLRVGDAGTFEAIHSRG